MAAHLSNAPQTPMHLTRRSTRTSRLGHFVSAVGPPVTWYVRRVLESP
jgi:hypothetical protein